MLAPHIAEHFANLARSGPDVLQPISMMYVADDCEQAGSMAINGPDVHQPMSMMLATNDSNQVTEKTLGIAHDPSGPFVGESVSAVHEGLIGYTTGEDFSDGHNGNQSGVDTALCKHRLPRQSTIPSSE